MKKILIVIIINCASLCAYAASDREERWISGIGVEYMFSTRMLLNVEGTYGISLSNGLYCGAGIGIIINNNRLINDKCRVEIPVFGEIEYSFLREKTISPNIGVRFGLLGDYSDHGTGYLAEPYMGITMGKFKLRIGIMRLSATYNELGKKNEIPSIIGSRYENTGLSLGLHYRF